MKSGAIDPLDLPFKLLIAYYFIEYVRPQDRVGVVGALRIGLLVTLASAFLWFQRGDKSVLKDPLIRVHIGFIFTCAFTVTFAVNTYWVYQITQALILMLLAGVLPATTVLADPRRFATFSFAWIIFHIVLALTAFQTGGRGPGAFLGDENDLALALNMAVPYAFFLSQSRLVTSLQRNVYRIGFVLIAIASVFTWSRGGFLGLLAALGMIWLMSKNKIRNVLVMVALGLSVLGGFAAFSEKGSVLAEFETINDPNDSTRKDRLDSWKTGWQMYLDNPVFGVGASNYGWRAAEYQLKDPNFDLRRGRLRGGRAAHSLYFTLMPELGTVGVVLFLSMVGLIVAKCRRVIKLRTSDPSLAPTLEHLALTAKAIIVALVAYLVSGTFITVVYYPHLFYLVGFAVAVGLASARLLPSIETVGSRNRAPQPRAQPRTNARPSS